MTRGQIKRAAILLKRMARAEGKLGDMGDSSTFILKSWGEYDEGVIIDRGIAELALAAYINKVRHELKELGCED